ncbi:Protein CBG03968 [Caenorhabditis briggsae]|uniref:Protein CBG03968 n=1 Tax=Caenorhabditis briggsae TaxID=6238 RepID=A8WVV5_CAEBR|nr:Protein CBG03968 [Caenorhabditis briggsae]CAP24768.2 Protein CBG03968 [Caenorhabditis briggsae]
MYTDFSGYEHLAEKELNHRSISVAECREWIANKKCEYGSLGKGKEGIYSTNNKVNEDYPNRFTSFFTSKRYYKENCVIMETKVYSHFNQSRPSNVLSDLSNCKYQDGYCQPGKMNEIIIWDVNKDQKCQYISIGKLDGIMNNGLRINSQNQIALSLNKSKIIRDCNLNLLISEEGFAVKEIQKLPTPQALTSTPSLQEMSINPQKFQKEIEENYKRQQEQIQKDRELCEKLQTEKDKEVRDKYEADRKEFEKRREEKMKQYLEFEKRKKEKMERQGLLNTTTSVNSNTTNRIKKSTKRKQSFLEANQSLEDTSRPFPLPTYEEYSKIKNDCLLLRSYADYLRIKYFTMRFFNSDFKETSSSERSFIIITPKEKDKIQLVDNLDEEKIENNKKVSEGASITQKSLNTNRTEGLNKKNAAFLRALKRGSGFKRI